MFSHEPTLFEPRTAKQRLEVAGLRSLMHKWPGRGSLHDEEQLAARPRRLEGVRERVAALCREAGARYNDVLASHLLCDRDSERTLTMAYDAGRDESMWCKPCSL